MPLPERTYRHVDTTRSPSIATMEQFLRGGESSRVSPTYSPTSSSPSSPYFVERLKHHDPEEDHGLYQRKLSSSSVLSRVKEKARKLRYSLSKKRQEEENPTPSWGVSLEDEEEEEKEEDAEYLGAPIYESELAPEEYKENARQHPRANPVISEKRVLRTNTVNSGVEQDRENPLTPVKSTTTITQPATTTTSPNMRMSESLLQKLTPDNNAEEGSNAAHSASSKSSSVSSVRTPMQNSSSSLSSNNPLSGKFNTTTTTTSYSPKGGYNNMTAISPRRCATSNNGGVIERVKGAVNSLLRNEEPYSSPQQKYAGNKTTPTTRANYPQITNAKQVGREENHGRILQEN